MKIDFSAPILDLDGEPVLTAKKNAKTAEDTEPMTLARAATTGLMAHDRDSKGWEEKADLVVLALRINQAGEQEITEAEAATIKKAIAAAYPSPLIAGRAAQLLKG